MDTESQPSNAKKNRQMSHIWKQSPQNASGGRSAKFELPHHALLGGPEPTKEAQCAWGSCSEQ